MIVPSGGFTGKTNNRISSNLKGSEISGQHGLKKGKLSNKDNERVNTESNQMEFDEDSSHQQRNVLDEMILTENTNPMMDDSDNEERKDEAIFD